jgi:hypothetical protein
MITNKLEGFSELKKDALDTLQYLYRRHRDKSIEYVLGIFHNWYPQIYVSNYDAKFIKFVSDANQIIKPLDFSNDFVRKALNLR